MKAKAKKVAVGVAGGLVIAIGVAMLVLPGPAFIVIPAGIAILATEFDCAKRWKQKAEDYFHKWRDDRKRKKAGKQTQAA